MVPSTRWRCLLRRTVYSLTGCYSLASKMYSSAIQSGLQPLLYHCITCTHTHTHTHTHTQREKNTMHNRYILNNNSVGDWSKENQVAAKHSLQISLLSNTTCKSQVVVVYILDVVVTNVILLWLGHRVIVSQCCLQVRTFVKGSVSMLGLVSFSGSVYEVF